MDHGINIEYAAKFNAAPRHPCRRHRAVTFEQAEEAAAYGRSSTSPCAARTSPIPTT
ncbi:MAG: hypothetical protein ACLUEK_03115 [Oscillospiraceae bacterium]